MKSQLEQSPTYAPTQAFVVQFGRETALDTGRMAGRVEHVHAAKALSSGFSPRKEGDRATNPARSNEHFH